MSSTRQDEFMMGDALVGLDILGTRRRNIMVHIEPGKRVSYENLENDFQEENTDDDDLDGNVEKNQNSKSKEKEEDD
ncbi:hypothetical protein ILUMI_23430 [Ignelater luminosus]|uniref:Uncharacterized protein n=1 Tax=Ignelater luminosus TaxID=2038154 RepID=A0A8K0G1N5_IGNLU|nr:hypothetical protein ILUMI_23430 [Ignelater luminosus]